MPATKHSFSRSRGVSTSSSRQHGRLELRLLEEVLISCNGKMSGAAVKHDKGFLARTEQNSKGAIHAHPVNIIKQSQTHQM